MTQKKTGVVAITGMILVILSVALLVPAIGASLESPQTLVLTQMESERVALTGSISTEAVSIEGGGNAAINISLVDESTGETRTTGSIAEGDSVTVSFADGDITVTNIDVVSNSEAIIEYNFPTFIGYPANASIFFENIVLFMVVSTFMLLAGTLLIVSEVIG